jgi:hypothetical protein
MAAQHKMAVRQISSRLFQIRGLTPVRHVGKLALRFPLLLFVPRNLGFFFGIRIIDECRLRFLRRASGKRHATRQQQ